MERKRQLAIYYSGIPVLGFLLFFVRSGQLDTFTLFQYELLLVFGYIATIIDIKEKRIPNKLVLTMLGIWMIMLFCQLFININIAIFVLKDALLGFAIGGGLFLLVYMISRKGLGGGDVKFMAATGLYLGVANILSAMLYGTLLAALTALTLLLLKKIGRKDTIPLAPFLYLGILIAIFYG